MPSLAPACDGGSLSLKTASARVHVWLSEAGRLAVAKNGAAGTKSHTLVQQSPVSFTLSTHL